MKNYEGETAEHPKIIHLHLRTQSSMAFLNIINAYVRRSYRRRTRRSQHSAAPRERSSMTPSRWPEPTHANPSQSLMLNLRNPDPPPPCGMKEVPHPPPTPVRTSPYQNLEEPHQRRRTGAFGSETIIVGRGVLGVRETTRCMLTIVTYHMSIGSNPVLAMHS